MRSDLWLCFCFASCNEVNKDADDSIREPRQAKCLWPGYSRENKLFERRISESNSWRDVSADQIVDRSKTNEDTVESTLYKERAFSSDN
jgi:hypothetical protein